MRLHLVDGTFELFRAHYARRPDRDHKATVGMVQSMLGLLKDEQVTHIAVAFDNPIHSFRNDLYAGYKSDEGVDPVLRRQFDAAEDAMRALGLVVWSMKEWECDDAIATAAVRFKHQVDQVRIMSPDKDFGQVLDNSRVVLVDRMRKKTIDERAYVEKMGVRPKSVADYLALVGDPADGFPGLPGIGARTASALLSVYEHIEAIPEDPKEWTVAVRGAENIAAVLREHREDALLYRKLATLVTRVPLKESLDDLAFRGVPGTFSAWCKKMNAPFDDASRKPRAPR
jgi:5'-3' exonuclease